MFENLLVKVDDYIFQCTQKLPNNNDGLLFVSTHYLDNLLSITKTLESLYKAYETLCFHNNVWFFDPGHNKSYQQCRRKPKIL